MGAQIAPGFRSHGRTMHESKARGLRPATRPAVLTVCLTGFLLVKSLWPRNGVAGMDNTQRTGNPAYVYMASPSVSWWTNDIEAHISPTKSAGAPDVPAVLPHYFDAESNAFARSAVPCRATARPRPRVRAHGKPFRKLVDERHRGAHFTLQKRWGPGRASCATPLLRC